MDVGCIQSTNQTAIIVLRVFWYTVQHYLYFCYLDILLSLYMQLLVNRVMYFGVSQVKNHSLINLLNHLTNQTRHLYTHSLYSVGVQQNKLFVATILTDANE